MIPADYRGGGRVADYRVDDRYRYRRSESPSPTPVPITDDYSYRGGGGGLAAPLLERQPLPHWWLAFLGVFCLVPAVTNSMVMPLLLPPLVEKLVGDDKKAASLGLLSSAQFVVSLAMPFIGTWSDKCTGTFALRFGRRRPFVVVGCLLSTCGLVLLRLASTFPMVVLGFAVLIAGNVTSWVPYMTVLPEVVPATQRGVAASYQMVVDSISWGLGSGLGVAVGQKLISEDQTYLLLIVLNLLQMPIGIASMGRAQGCCQPELRPTAPPARTTHRPRGVGQGCLESVRDFFSAFRRSRAFCLLWAYLSISYIAALLVGTWQFYWCARLPALPSPPARPDTVA